MVSLSRADNSVRDKNINENKNVSPNILGRPLTYLGGPVRESLCVGNTGVALGGDSRTTIPYLVSKLVAVKHYRSGGDE